MPTVGTDFTTNPLSAAFPSCFQIPSAFPVFAESSASLPLIPWLVLHGETGTKRILTPGSVFLCHPILSCLCQLGVFWRHSEARGRTRMSPSLGSLPTRIDAAAPKWLFIWTPQDSFLVGFSLCHVHGGPMDSTSSRAGGWGWR